MMDTTKQKKNVKPRELHAQGGTGWKQGIYALLKNNLIHYSVPLPGIPDIPHSRIELMLSARYTIHILFFILIIESILRNLKDKDVLSKSDPVCVVYLMMHKGDKQEPKYTEIGRTEVIDNNLNPQWETKIQVCEKYDFFSKN